MRRQSDPKRGVVPRPILGGGVLDEKGVYTCTSGSERATPKASIVFHRAQD